MVSEFPEMTLKTIGVVRNGFPEAPTPRSDWEKVTSELVIDESLTEALDGIEEFSHIIVLFWIHRLNEKEPPLKQRPMGQKGRPLKGLFALRSPNRPNPIGKTTARLLERRDNILRVEGLDALDGSPVIDIKPYMPGYDAAVDATVPAWIIHD
jgi:tRNA-Thr(GGU) m(6)t(6)A37 methyltransferase TsaA